MDKEELIKQIRAGRHASLDLEGADLEGADLTAANLKGAKLRGANLRNAKLRGAKLNRAVLDVTDLRGVDLERANLDRAFLQGALLSAANLDGAFLQGADLRDTTLYEARLDDADLKGADLRKADLERAALLHADLEGADLRAANLFNADLEGTILLNCEVTKQTVIRVTPIYEIKQNRIVLKEERQQPPSSESIRRARTIVSYIEGISFVFNQITLPNEAPETDHKALKAVKDSLEDVKLELASANDEIAAMARVIESLEDDKRELSEQKKFVNKDNLKLSVENQLLKEKVQTLTENASSYSALIKKTMVATATTLVTSGVLSGAYLLLNDNMDQIVDLFRSEPASSPEPKKPDIPPTLEI